VRTTAIRLALGVIATAVPVVAQGPNSDGPSTQAITCAHNFANGGATGLSWCVSAQGTMPKFASPPAFEHIQVGAPLEGYVICSGAAPLAYDLSAFEAGMGAFATIAGPTGSGVTVRRFAGAAGFEVDNKYKADLKENDVTISMTVKNVGPPRSNVTIARMFDPDVDGDWGDEIHDKGSRSVWARDTLNSNAVTLTGTTFGAFTSTAVGTAFPALNCTDAGVALPTGPSDHLVRVTQSVGNMATGQTKKVTFVYRRN
jgi:hypothetical protein